MKLVMTVVQKEDAGELVDGLIQKGFRTTRIDTAGGFLKSGNTTLLIGVEDSQVEVVLELIRSRCNRRTVKVNPTASSVMPGQFYMPFSMEVEVGGATVFVLPVDHYERI